MPEQIECAQGKVERSGLENAEFETIWQSEWEQKLMNVAMERIKQRISRREFHLQEVVEFYKQGGQANPHLDPTNQPLNLSGREMADLILFLKALTSETLPEN